MRGSRPVRGRASAGTWRRRRARCFPACSTPAPSPRRPRRGAGAVRPPAPAGRARPGWTCGRAGRRPSLPVEAKLSTAVPAEERVHRHRVGAQPVERRLRVRVCRGGDVAALRVQDHRAAGSECDEADEHRPGVQPGTPRLVEGAVRLERAGKRLRRFHHRAHAPENVPGRDVQGRIEPDTEEGIAAPAGLIEGGERMLRASCRTENRGWRFPWQDQEGAPRAGRCIFPSP